MLAISSLQVDIVTKIINMEIYMNAKPVEI